MESLASKQSDFGFSIDPDATVRALRALAESIEQKTAILTKAVQYRINARDDYEISGVVIHFTGRVKKVDPHVVTLYGNDQVFPIDATKTGGTAGE